MRRNTKQLGDASTQTRCKIGGALFVSAIGSSTAHVFGSSLPCDHRADSVLVRRSG